MKTGLKITSLILACVLSAIAFASPEDDFQKGEVAYEAENTTEAVKWYKLAAERIYDRETEKISYGAVIVKKVDAKTRAKTAINELLRLND